MSLSLKRGLPPGLSRGLDWLPERGEEYGYVYLSIFLEMPLSAFYI
jgi:hypothetical protein